LSIDFRSISATVGPKAPYGVKLCNSNLLLPSTDYRRGLSLSMVALLFAIWHCTDTVLQEKRDKTIRSCRRNANATCSPPIFETHRKRLRYTYRCMHAYGISRSCIWTFYLLYNATNFFAYNNGYQDEKSTLMAVLPTQGHVKTNASSSSLYRKCDVHINISPDRWCRSLAAPRSACHGQCQLAVKDMGWFEA